MNAPAFDRRGRATLPGEVPTSWKRPPRSTVVGLLLVVGAFFGFLLVGAGNLEVLDKRWFYGPQTAVAFLQGLDPAERAAYVAFNVADFAFIVVYSAWFATWIAFLRNRLALDPRFHPILGFVPGLADALETYAVATLLRAETVAVDGFVWLAVVTTPLKWLLLLGLIIVGLRGEVRWWKRRRARRASARR